ncbi:hypothetical protein RB195_023295 [Necator americanus]|uniref:Uncharacterized protein n=1 Tax=Necator americanus TaxID=51031 RepID=A0ABR1EIK0_NECAM
MQTTGTGPKPPRIQTQYKTRLTMKTERKRNGKKFIDDDSDLEEEARNILQTDRKLLQNCFICGKRNPDANDDD